MMKKYIWMLIVAVIASACADDDYNTAFREFVGIRTTGVPANVSENSAGITIPVLYGGTAKNSRPVTVNWEVTGGTYGTDYTVVGATGPAGTVVVPAGTTWTEAINQIVIQGIADFDNEEDVPLTLTLTSADNGVQVGYPMSVSYNFVIADDDCLFDFEGDLGGIDANLDLAKMALVADVTVVKNSETEYTFQGLGFGMILEFWGETVTDFEPTVATIAPGGAITIEEQYVYTTDYNGAVSTYSIKGTGQVNYCAGTVSINYDVIYTSGGTGSVAAAAKDFGYMSGDLFVATLKPVVDED